MAGFGVAFARPPAAAHRDPGGLQIAADRLAPDRRSPRSMRRQRPAQPSEREDLLLFVVVQDVAHPGEGLHVHRLRQRLGRRQLMAGFAGVD